MVKKAEPKMPSERQLRVSTEIRHVLSSALLTMELYDDDLTPSMVMITDVKVSPDFSWATIYVHSIGQTDENLMVEALNRHKGAFRKIIGDTIRLRITPDVRFRLDNGFEEARKIEALFDNPIVKADIAKKD
ncbi:MAG: 30S ribosome-binding factor RbfA [Alphaproteobacteria bacterium]|nr:30S ribosome-binding factor RbfA [Alphaproteobacteria bacterium]